MPRARSAELAAKPCPCAGCRRRRPKACARRPAWRRSSRTSSAVTASMRSISSAGSISRSIQQQWRAICSARADELSRPISRPALSCALERASSSHPAAFGRPHASAPRRRRRSARPSSPVPVAAWMPNSPVSRQRPAARIDRVAEAAASPAPPGTAATTCPRRTAPRTPGPCRTPASRYDGPCESRSGDGSARTALPRCACRRHSAPARIAPAVAAIQPAE